MLGHKPLFLFSAFTLCVGAAFMWGLLAGPVTQVGAEQCAVVFGFVSLLLTLVLFKKDVNPLEALGWTAFTVAAFFIVSLLPESVQKTPAGIVNVFLIAFALRGYRAMRNAGWKKPLTFVGLLGSSAIFYFALKEPQLAIPLTVLQFGILLSVFFAHFEQALTRLPAMFVRRRPGESVH
jgi:hypothetical protein